MVAYRERLEIGFAFDAITGERVERPEEELGTALDGIYCRDETIRGQDERLAELKAQLAALQLHWSTKKPTVPGPYWWRSQESVNGQKFPKVCHVFENNKVLYVEGLGVGSFYLKNASGEWAGPIPLPEEAR